MMVMMPPFVVPVAVAIVVEEVVIVDEEDNIAVEEVVVVIVNEAEVDVIGLQGITEDASGDEDAIGEARATPLLERWRPLS
jgi:ribonuclease PH